MTDLHLRQLVPIDLRLFLSDDECVYLPGEISVRKAMLIEAIRGDIWSATQERTLAENREQEAEGRRLLEQAWDAARAKVVELAKAHPDNDPKLIRELADSLTVTQIDTILSVIVAPPTRDTLMALAYSKAMGIPIEEIEADPLGGGSSGNSSESDEPEDSEAPTGTTSRGASSSRSAPKRSRTSRPKK